MNSSYTRFDHNSISASSKENDGTKENRFLGTDGNSIDAQSVRAQLAFEPTDSLTVIAGVYHGEQDGIQGLYKQLGLVDLETFEPCANPYLGNPACGDFFGYQDDDDFNSTESDFEPKEEAEVNGTTLNISWDIGQYTLNAITGYVDYEDDRDQDVDASGVDVLRTGFTGQSDQFSQEVRLSSYDSPDFQWVLGAYYFTGELEQQSTIAARGLGPGGISEFSDVLEALWFTYEEETDTTAVFAEGTWALTDDISFTAGLRWTWEDKEAVNNSYLIDVDDIQGAVPPDADYSDRIIFPLIENFQDSQDTSEPSWRLVVDYRLSDDVLTYVSISEGFKSGVGSSQATFDPAEAGFTEPEFIIAYEIGIKSHWFDQKVRLNASAFYYDFQDQQVSIFENAALTQSNVGESTIVGAEVELAVLFSDHWSANFGLGLLDAEYDEFDAGDGVDYSGNQLVAAPDLDFSGLLLFEAPLASGRFSAQVDVSYTDDQFFSPSNDPLLAQDSYWLAGSRVSYLFADERIEVALWVKNMFDEEYVIDAFDTADFGFNLLFPATERTYGINLLYNF